MKLAFYARQGHVVHYPGVKVAGSMPMYVGRKNAKIKEGDKVVGFSHPAVETPVEVDANSKIGARFLKICRRAPQDLPLWPADEQTARACGVPFVKVELVDGEYQPIRSAPSKPAQATSSKGGK